MQGRGKGSDEISRITLLMEARGRAFTYCGLLQAAEGVESPMKQSTGLPKAWNVHNMLPPPPGCDMKLEVVCACGFSTFQASGSTAEGCTSCLAEAHSK